MLSSSDSAGDRFCSPIRYPMIVWNKDVKLRPNKDFDDN